MAEPPDYLQPDEVRHRLQRLRPADSLRLAELARVWARRAGQGTEDGDLLNEALARVLEGRRKWPVSVPLATFFSQVMRSIAGETRALRSREPTVVEGLDVRVEPSNRIEVASLTLAIRRILASDEVVLGLFELELKEASPREIQKFLGLSSTKYDTARRRLRRTLLTAFPDGFPL